MSFTKVHVTFLDGSTETVQGYRVEHRDGILRVRTSHDTSYRNDWMNYPLTSIKRWRIE